MPRLGYQKSRNGCVRCKQRKVKCDERIPCTACNRHGVKCSLTTKDARKSDALQYPKPSRSRALHRRRELSSRTSSSSPPEASDESPFEGSGMETVRAPTDGNAFPYLANFMTNRSSWTATSWVADLELMHHFTAFTWSSLPRGPELQESYQIELPRLALEYDFLMHQLLAISASHMACLYPSRRNEYSIRSSQHQDNAIQGLRSILSGINDDNCHAVFITASMLSINAFAASAEHMVVHQQHQEHQRRSGPTIDDLLEVFFLIRGMHEILGSYEKKIACGPLSQMLNIGVHPSETSPLLSTIAEELGLLSFSGEGADRRAADVCQAEANRIIEAIRHANSHAIIPELRVVMAWPIHQSDAYASLVREREPTSLKLVSYFCRLLESVEPMSWYLKGWNQSISAELRGFIGAAN